MHEDWSWKESINVDNRIRRFWMHQKIQHHTVEHKEHASCWLWAAFTSSGKHDPRICMETRGSRINPLLDISLVIALHLAPLLAIQVAV